MKKNVVLFVDDEANILNSLRRAVIDQEFEALFANSAYQALLIMKDTPIDVLVTDMRMPDMDGLALLKAVKQDYPDTVRIVLSGYTQLAQVLATINHGDIFKFITKPWQEEDLISILDQAMEYYNLRRDKKELQLMLHERNTAYKKMLHTMEGKLSAYSRDMEHIKDFYSNAMGYLASKDNPYGKDAASICNQLTICQQLMDNCVSTLPAVLNDFSVGDFTRNLKKQILDAGGQQFQVVDQTDPSLRCLGNTRLILLMMTALVKLLNSAESDRNFQCKISSHVYPDKVVINNIIEIGYVDGVQTLINRDAVLTKTNLDFYCHILNLLGKPYSITTTFTYGTVNDSLVALVVDLPYQNK